MGNTTTMERIHHRYFITLTGLWMQIFQMKIPNHAFTNICG